MRVSVDMRRVIALVLSATAWLGACRSPSTPTLVDASTLGPSSDAVQFGAMVGGPKLER